ncbi:MAG: lipid-A-disaccharide synthase [Deltaproteobacteria bacterium]|uniref:Lipid-A-disaccharide synthase n=1 Tax=Candidatus Zymogenus saltonus TaxID=2844893 RepID=A0A9D8KGL2_9DELT|nr:lipid-A-disaccharide synthase [Candidatus Zymogenus saltonus]
MTSPPDKLDGKYGIDEIKAHVAKKRVLIVAGEASGDQYGAELMREVAALSPDTLFFGVGGSKMRDAGLLALVRSEEITVVGLVEVVKHLKTIKGALDLLKESMRALKPDLIVLIDFPDFNFRVADAAVKLGKDGGKMPIFYYISPQVWAWRRGRVKTIARFADKMVVIFPFEVNIYREAGVDVEFLGHPLMDVVAGVERRLKGGGDAKVGGGKPNVALLPGSRRSEIERHLSHLLGASEIIKRKYPDASFTIPLAPTLEMEDVAPYLEDTSLNVAVVKDSFHRVVRGADIAIVSSGTATIETALMGTPMVVVYRLNYLTYMIARLLVRVDYIAMVNLVAKKRVVPELIQSDVNAENIARHVISILSDDAVMKRMREDLSEVRRRIGKPGASARVAERIMNFL